MPLRTLRKLKRRDFNYAVHFRTVGDMDAFIYRKPGDLAELMVAVRSEGTDAVRGKSYILGGFAVS